MDSSACSAHNFNEALEVEGPAHFQQEPPDFEVEGVELSTASLNLNGGKAIKLLGH